MVLCALNVSLSQVNINLFSKLDYLVESNFNKQLHIERMIYLFGGICTIIFIMNTYNWLPFLGETVFPSSLVPLKTVEVDTTVTVNTLSNTKIAYWSSKPSDKKTPGVEEAYDDYSNSGVVMSDSNGKAVLTFNKGTDYIVPGGKLIKKHVHYRVLDGDWALIGPVKTVYI
jgi:hypothetical protein